jgi:hypothetical protein
LIALISVTVNLFWYYRPAIRIAMKDGMPWAIKLREQVFLPHVVGNEKVPSTSVIVPAYDGPQTLSVFQPDYNIISPSNQDQPKRQRTGPINTPPPALEQPDGTAISSYTFKESALPQSVGTESLKTDTKKKLNWALKTTFFSSELSKLAARWIEELEPQRKELYGWYSTKFTTTMAVIPPWWPISVPYRKPQSLLHNGKHRSSTSYTIF